MKGREEDLREDPSPVHIAVESEGRSVHLLVRDCAEEGWYASISLGKDSWTRGRREDLMEGRSRAHFAVVTLRVM